MPPRDHNYNIDGLRILATWLIVSAHVLTNIKARPDFFGGTVWWLSHGLYIISIPATPIFFLISGYLLADKHPTIRQNCRRTWNRLLLPFIVFTLLGTIVYNALEFRISWSQFLNHLLYGGRTHLYFLLGLSLLHLLYPLWSRYTRRFSIKNSINLSYLLLAVSALLIIATYLIGHPQLLNLSFVYWFLVMGYFVFGANYTHWRTRHPRKHPTRDLVLVALSLAGISYLSYWFLSRGRADPLSVLTAGSTYLESYLSIPMMVVSLVFFNLAMRFQLQPRLTHFSQKLLRFFSVHSYGVYLVHMIVLEFLLQKTPITPYNPQLPLIGFLILGFGLTLLSSYLISWTISRLPYLRLAIGQPR